MGLLMIYSSINWFNVQVCNLNYVGTLSNAIYNTNYVYLVKGPEVTFSFVLLLKGRLEFCLNIEHNRKENLGCISL